ASRACRPCHRQLELPVYAAVAVRSDLTPSRRGPYLRDPPDEEGSFMFKRIASILIAVAFAAAGVVAGRLFLDLRRQVDEGEELHIDADRVRIQPRELVPGLIAAMRVHDRPWSFLHVPGWLAAFAINFGFVAFASELAPVRAVLGFD